MKTIVGNALRLLENGARSLQSPFLLFVRLYWGWQFLQTGWGKVNNLGKVTQFFTNLGIPFPALNAPFIAGLELFGGIFLILGAVSRPMSLLLAIDMLVAYVVADRDALLSLISDPDKFTGATPYTFLMASLIVLIFGPGKFSLDAWIESWRRAPAESPARARAQAAAL